MSKQDDAWITQGAAIFEALYEYCVEGGHGFRNGSA
jgi:hypothetical protein